RMMLLDERSEVLARQVELLRRSDFAEAADALIARGPAQRDLATGVPRLYRRITAGEVIPVGAGRWQVMVGSGHSPEMAALYEPERGILIAADQLVPGTLPHVQLPTFEPEGDPI